MKEKKEYLVLWAASTSSDGEAMPLAFSFTGKRFIPTRRGGAPLYGKSESLKLIRRTKRTTKRLGWRGWDYRRWKVRVD